jgi:hypothetical protein
VETPPKATIPQVPSHPEDADLALFSKIAQNFWFGATSTTIFQHKLAASLLRKKPDAIMCLVLLMCPNIEILEIVGKNERGFENDTLLDSLLIFLLVAGGTKQAVGSVAPDEMLQRSLILQRVQNLTLAACPLRLTWPGLMAVFSPPELRTSRIRHLCKIWPGRFSARGITLGPPRCSKLKSLELDPLHIPGT